MRRFLEGLARLRRLVVLLDDVHWGQPTFLDLIEHLAAWGRDAPILVVALARPELREIRPALTERNEAVSEVIDLGPLAPSDSRALVDRLLGEADLPPELAERVLETTEGNPLFLGEMLRMLVDDGVLERVGRPLGRARGAGGIVVPPTVHALLADAHRAPERGRARGRRARRGHRPAVLPRRRRRAAARRTTRRAWPSTSTACAARSWSRRRGRSGRARRSSASTTSSSATPRTARCSRRRAPSCTSASPHWLEGREGDHEELAALHLERAYAYRDELGAARRRRPRAGRARRRAAAPRRPPRARARGPARRGQPADARARTRSTPTTRSACGCSPTSPRRSCRPATPRRPRRRSRSSRCAPRRSGDERAQRAGHGVRLPARDPHRRRPRARDDRARQRRRRRCSRAPASSAAEAKAHHVAAQAHSLLGEIAAAEEALDRALVAARAARDQPPRHRRAERARRAPRCGARRRSSARPAAASTSSGSCG